MSLPLGIFSDRPLRMRIDRRSHQICQWEYIWSYFHLAEFIGTGGGDIQSPGHQTRRNSCHLSQAARVAPWISVAACNLKGEEEEPIPTSHTKEITNITS